MPSHRSKGRKVPPQPRPQTITDEQIIQLMQEHPGVYVLQVQHDATCQGAADGKSCTCTPVHNLVALSEERHAS